MVAMKRNVLILYVVLITLSIVIGCKKTDESYFAPADYYSYDEQYDYDATYRYLYKNNPTPLDEGSSLFYYIGGYAHGDRDKPKEKRRYSEYYVVIQPSVDIHYSDGTSCDHEIHIDKEDFDSFKLAVISLRHLEGKDRALRETLLTIFKEKSWQMHVDPAKKSIAATLGFDSIDYLNTSTSLELEKVETMIRAYPISFSVYYDLFTDVLNVDMLVSYTDNKPLDIKKIDISTDSARFSYSDFSKTEAQKGNIYVEQALIERFGSENWDHLEDVLVPLFDSKSLFINFIGTDGESSKISLSNLNQRWLGQHDDLAAILIIYREMLKGEIDSWILTRVSQSMYHYDADIDGGYR